MPSKLPTDLITRVKPLLLPYVGEKSEREALFIETFFLRDPRPMNQINFEGSAEVFTIRCIADLVQKIGCLAESGEQQHSLAALLMTVRARCDPKKHGEIDSLLPVLNDQCITPLETPAPAPPVDPSDAIQSIHTPQSERTPTVFISYSHADDAFAKRLIADLNAAGHACWIDTSAIKGGADWQRAIVDGINLSYALVVVCTHKSLESEYVWDEIQWARTRRKLIIPLLVEDVTADDRFFGLHRFQGIRFDTLPYPEAFEGLLAALPGAPLRMDAPRTISRREHELAYLDRLRFDDFRLEKFELAEYAALGGVAETYREISDQWAKLSIEQSFSVIHAARADEVEAAQEEFTDAVSKINALGRAVVLGDPGAGKTHTLRAIAKPLYTAALNDPKAPLPLLVKLGNWDKPDQPFDVFLRSSLGELGAYLDDLFTENRAVLLLDGLNEFPANQRKAKYPQVETFIKAHPETMAIVTCREADYPISLGLNKVLIRPLDPLRIRDFARRALRAVESDDAFFWKLVGEDARRFERRFQERFADKITGWERVFWLSVTLPDGMKWEREFVNTYYYSWDLWRGIRDNSSSILTLARNPYMLRMLIDVYIQYKGVLPTNRGQLFAQFVNVLLEREKLAEIDATTQAVRYTDEGQNLLTGLQRIAFEMQVQRAGRGKSDEASAGTSLPMSRVREVLNDRLLYLAVSASIVTSGVDVRFSHQLLQEYFAAQYMDIEIKAGRLKASTIWKPENWWERTNWEEAVILLAGLYSDDCSRVVEWVNEANPEVAAMGVMRSGAGLADSTREKLQKEWLSRLTDTRREPNPLARAAIGRALGLTDWDNRKGVNVIVRDGIALPDIEWVDIPAGKFTMGHKGESDNPPRILTLDYSFQISRYPVTYKQFQAFLDDPKGFSNSDWWEGLAIPTGHNNAPGDQAYKFWNHPRERVSWYDAIAFCRWLSWRLGGGYVLDAVEKWAVRLPTEFEWEKAARANTGWVYPYGNDFDAAKGNTDETGINQTSAVGILPAGDAPHWSTPLSDLSGNVFEWCLTDYNNPAEKAQDENISSGSERGLRGGSWRYGKGAARAVGRIIGNPSDRSLSFGFRVLRLPCG